jgi:predicted component of type VI protein secretion system
MSMSVSFGTLRSQQSVGAEAPKDDTPFRVAVLADFSGRGLKGEVGTADEIGRRRPRKVDRENRDDLMAKLKVDLTLPVGVGGLPETIAFRTLDDFHPDNLHAKVGGFRDAFDRDEKAELLGKLLHDPDFQALESAWLGLDWLLKVTANCPEVEVKLIDLSIQELAADLAEADALESTGLYQILVDQPAQRGEMDPWSLLVGLYLFEPSAAHANLLGRIARVARQASAPFLAGTTPALHAPDFKLEGDAAEVWSALRQLPEAAMLALATPRFLLRPPYGENTRSVDAFEYEESNNKTGWPHYLWGNPALACASVLIRSFEKDGWSMRAGSILGLPGMAMHIVRDEDDEPLSILAEAWLTKSLTERLVGMGLIPLLSVRGRDEMALLGVHSLAQPPKGERTSPLLGRWGQKGTVVLPRSGDKATGATPPSRATAASGRTKVSAPAPDDDMAAMLGNMGTTGHVAAPSEMDPELAAMLGNMGTTGGVAASSDTDPELAAMLGDMRARGHERTPDQTDPEFAAMLGDMTIPPPPAPKGKPEPAKKEDAAPPPAAEPEMDPELAALLADLGGGAPAAPTPAAPAAEPEMDPELAALLADLGGDAPAAPAPAPAEPEMDPELAALLADLEGGSPQPERAAAPAPAPPPAPAEPEMDPELAALLADLEGGETKPP